MVEEIILKILGIVSIVFFAVLFIKGVVIDSIIGHYDIKKRNKDFIEQNNLKGRRKLLCVECKYCQTFLDRPFYSRKYHNAFRSRLPKYCRKFRMPLKWDIYSRCISRLAEDAMWETEPINSIHGKGDRK